MEHKELDLAQTIEGLGKIAAVLGRVVVREDADYIRNILVNAERYLKMIEEVHYDTWDSLERRLSSMEHPKPECKVIQFPRGNAS